MAFGKKRNNRISLPKQSSVYIWKYVVNGVTAIVLFLFLSMQIMPCLGYEPYRILSGSMEPTLTIGEIVLIDTNDREIDVGEIIAFSEGRHVVIHRVQEMKGSGLYTTKGDANPTADFDAVRQTEVIGTFWLKLGVLTGIWDFFSSNGRYVVILILVLLNGSLETWAGSCEDEEVEYA